MVISVRTEAGQYGLEVIKTADDDRDRLRLVEEADLLRRAAGTGAVDVIASTVDELRLHHPGAPLSQELPLPTDHAVAVVCAVADIVDSLHQRGIAHGSVRAEHVLLAIDGHPRLSEFGHANEIDDLGDLAAADDVAALGALLDRVLDAGRDHPWSPANSGTRHRTRRKQAKEDFDRIAGMAQRDDPVQRPTARQFATALRDSLSPLELPDADDDGGEDDGGEAVGGEIDGGGIRARTAGSSGDATEAARVETGFATGSAVVGDASWRDEWPTADTADDGDGDGDADDPWASAPVATEVPPTRPAPAAADTEPNDDRAESTDDVADPADHARTARRRLDDALRSGPPPIEIPDSGATTRRRRRRPDDDSENEPTPEAPSPPAEADEASPPRPRRAPRGDAADSRRGPTPPWEAPSATAPPRPRPSQPSPPTRPGGDARSTDGADDDATPNYVRWLLPAALVAAGVVLAVLAWQMLSPFGGDDPTDAPPASESVAELPAAELGTPSAWPEDCELPSLTGPDLDDDGCPEPVVLSGTEATVGGIPIAFGEQGDVLAVADVNCDGVVTPFLLRPSTGEVFVWPEWATESTVEVSVATAIDGATDFVAHEGECDVLAVTVGSDEILVAGSP